MDIFVYNSIYGPVKWYGTEHSRARDSANGPPGYAYLGDNPIVAPYAIPGENYFGPRFGYVRPPGLPLWVKPCSVKGDGERMVLGLSAWLAQEYQLPYPEWFMASCVQLSRKESNSTIGRPANTFSLGGEKLVTAYGCYQYNRGAWQRLYRPITNSDLPAPAPPYLKKEFPWDSTGLSEVMWPIANQFILWVAIFAQSPDSLTLEEKLELAIVSIFLYHSVPAAWSSLIAHVRGGTRWSEWSHQYKSKGERLYSIHQPRVRAIVEALTEKKTEEITPLHDYPRPGPDPAPEPPNVFSGTTLIDRIGMVIRASLSRGWVWNWEELGVPTGRTTGSGRVSDEYYYVIPLHFPGKSLWCSLGEREFLWFPAQAFLYPNNGHFDHIELDVGRDMNDTIYRRHRDNRGLRADVRGEDHITSKFLQFDSYPRLPVLPSNTPQELEVSALQVLDSHVEHFSYLHGRPGWIPMFDFGTFPFLTFYWTADGEIPAERWVVAFPIDGQWRWLSVGQSMIVGRILEQVGWPIEQ